MLYHPGVIFVIKCKDKFLVARARGHPDWDFYFPGGGLDEGESKEQAFFREVYEELGLRRKDLLWFKDLGFSYQYDWPKKFQTESIRGQTKQFFLAEIP